MKGNQRILRVLEDLMRKMVLNEDRGDRMKKIQTCIDVTNKVCSCLICLGFFFFATFNVSFVVVLLL